MWPHRLVGRLTCVSGAFDPPTRRPLARPADPTDRGIDWTLIVHAFGTRLWFRSISGGPRGVHEEPGRHRGGLLGLSEVNPPAVFLGTLGVPQRHQGESLFRHLQHKSGLGVHITSRSSESDVAASRHRVS